MLLIAHRYYTILLYILLKFHEVTQLKKQHFELPRVYPDIESENYLY